MSSLLNWALVGDVIIAVAAYEVGKVGLKAAASVVYNWYNKIFKNNNVSTQTIATTATTPTATA